ncbi:MAG: aldehyde dehydrogenase family protein, partial [Clostridia bacterium]
LIAEIRRMYGSAPLVNEELPHIINRHHFDRLIGLLGSGAVAIGGQADEKTLKIAPTVLSDVSWDSPVMQEEIFGPILPILTYRKLDEAIAEIQARAKPLALYLFTRDKAVERK